MVSSILMSWLDLRRVPEPEVMDDSDEVEAYSSAAAQAYLDKIDDTFVDHAVRLVAGRTSGRALDIGTGPGQIVLKLARHLPSWQFLGVDRSPNMIAQARRNLSCAANPLDTPVQGTPGLKGRVQFFVSDGNRLPFPGADFDLVMCNSVLHHLAQPQRLLAEVARLVKPDGAVLIRDLRRPSRLACPLHVRWYGRHYSGLMYRLYCASVRSAYTVRELKELLHASRLTGASVFTHHRTHLGLERPAP
jgi:ubiquinone/menaquinone biosynthesis C-methylase UbiE